MIEIDEAIRKGMPDCHVHGRHWIDINKFLNHGWFNEKHALELYNRFSVGSYSIAWVTKCPEQHIWPYDVKETLYTGLAGGYIGSYRGDKKTKGKRKMTIKSPLLD